LTSADSAPLRALPVRISPMVKIRQLHRHIW